MNKNIIFLRHLNYKDIHFFGGKGASLGRLIQMGIDVPDAFVINTNINQNSLLKFKEDILKSFNNLNSQYVAVRSSATEEDSLETSFAGQFDTFLNVNKKNLIKTILKCYKSIKSDRIISYCKSNNINHKKIRLAVVVQRMVQSEISGIAFSVNPISGESNEIMVEAGFGLGEYIVSGVITPDKYIFDKKTSKIKEMKINYQEYKLANAAGLNSEKKIALEKRNAQKLMSCYFKGLLGNIKKIEKNYKRPVDIEWAVENNILYITQARPITTLIK